MLAFHYVHTCLANRAGQFYQSIPVCNFLVRDLYKQTEITKTSKKGKMGRFISFGHQERRTALWYTT